MRILKHARLKGALLLPVAIMLGCGVTVTAQSAADRCRPASVIPRTGEEVPAKIVVDPPLAGPLAARGVVVIQYCAENVHLVPVFGAGALAASPRVGHLHVRLDDAPWVWADASGTPIILMGLPSGQHKLELDLEDANHHPLDKGTVTFVVPSMAPTKPPETRRTDLQRHDLSAAGRETIQARVDFDPGAVALPHTHPGEEIIYVLEGTLEYTIDGKTSVVKPGDVLFARGGAIHSVKNIGTGNGAELATYVVEKGKPLITPVSGDAAEVNKDLLNEGQGMIINSIHYTFAAKDADKAESLFRELREASVKEPGVVQFEVGRSSDDPNVFALWEVYRDKAAFDAHAASDHFKRLVVNGIRPLALQRSAASVVPIRGNQ